MNAIAKIIAILIAVLLVIVGARYLMGEDPVAPSAGLVREDFAGSLSSDNQEFLRVVRNLENVALDGSIFRDSAFISLVDFSVELSEQPKGRINPFRPINPLERELATFGNATSTN